MQPSSDLILPPLNNLPPHSYTILPPLAAQLLAHFTPSEEFTHSLLQHFTPPPPWQPGSYLIIPPLRNDPHIPTTFHPLPLGSPALTSFYFLWTIYPLTVTPFYAPGSTTLSLFYPLWTIYSLTLTTFYTLGSPALISFYPLWTNYALILKPFYPPPPWQPSSILLQLTNLLTHAYNILPPLATQF